MKRVSYFHEDEKNENEEDNIKTEDLFDIDDIMNNKQTKDILMNEHYFNYLHDVDDDIQSTYIYFKNANMCNHFLNNDEFDLDGLFFISLIYKYIRKDYKLDIFYNNLELVEPLFKEEKEEVKKNIIKQNTIVNVSKKFDWNTKSYN
jgi:hypothetical protein